MLKFLINNREKSNFDLRMFAKRLISLKNIIPYEIKSRIYILKGAKINKFCFIDCALQGKLENISVGYGAYVSSGVNIALHGKVDIGDFVVINSGVRILTGSHEVHSELWELVAKDIFIGKYAWISTGATILPGVVIGEGAVVGAGAVVAKNVEPFAIVVGNPAKFVGYRKVKSLKHIPISSVSYVGAWLGKSVILQKE